MSVELWADPLQDVSSGLLPEPLQAASHRAGEGAGKSGNHGETASKTKGDSTQANRIDSLRRILSAAGEASPESESDPSPESGPSKPDAPGLPGETHISAVRVYSTHAIDVVAEGEVELRRDAVTLTADRMIYREPTDEVQAEGNVCLRQGNGMAEMSGPSASFVVGAYTGEFAEPKYSMTRSRPSREKGVPGKTVSGGGWADSLRIEGENHYRATNATWSTCSGSKPDWYIKAGDIELDYDREIGTVKNSTLVFKDVPIFWLPWAEFPLAGQRHSGILPPSMESSTKTGFGFAVPYYWNIAPNYDLTLIPRYMSRRGVQLGAEARYLGATYNGMVRGEYMPNDSITGESRSLASLLHRQWLTPGLYGSIDFNTVSDDRYFEDLSSRISMSSKVNLLREGRLMYVGGGWWNLSALAQSYQTLTPDPDYPVVSPYRRLPQITLNAKRHGEFGFLGTSGIDFAWKSEFTRFTHPSEGWADATRLTAYPQLSLPLLWPGFYITPKIGLHYTRYNIDREQSLPGVRDSITRSVPIFSIDSGLTFERDTNLFGRDYTQTLEPRVYYLNTAYRRQDDIPLFDTSRYDFGFAQIFSENLYTGEDRIANANQLTVAVTSRLINPVTGAENLRAILGQRHYFQDQRVTLTYRDEFGNLKNVEEPRTRDSADVLAGFGVQMGRHASFDTLWQYNPNEGQTERYTATLRYNPGHTRAVNLSYRYANDVFRDVGISGQWPLWGRWYGVTRLTYSLKDSKMTETIAGLEYNGGCWVLRMGAHRYTTRVRESNSAYFLQLELNDFTSIGPGGNVVQLIERSVPGYGRINEPSGGLLRN
ncbi:MAG: LPS-assembly protein LptD [Azoarcus sp.]|jgi:LPS-assembly protein|nr:LPS-assembly protein LptD [Azoarcus sp.]